MPIGRIEVLEVAGDVLGNLLDPPLHLVGGEVLVAGVHRLELRTVDGDEGRSEQAQLSAQHHELRTGRLDRRAILAAEVGDGLVVRRQPPR